MRLIYTREYPTQFSKPDLGHIQQGDIADVLGKEEIEILKELGFENAPPFEGEVSVEPVTEEEVK